MLAISENCQRWGLVGLFNIDARTATKRNLRVVDVSSFENFRERIKEF